LEITLSHKTNVDIMDSYVKPIPNLCL